MSGEEVLELPALALGQGAESVGFLEVGEALVLRIASLAAHPGTAIPRESKYSRIFLSPSLIRPFTVPSGRSRSSAISLWVYPEKYASSSTWSCSAGSSRRASLTWTLWELRQASEKASLGCETEADASNLS